MKLMSLTVTGAGDRWFVMNGHNVYATYPSEEMARHAVKECLSNEADEVDGLSGPSAVGRGLRQSRRGSLRHPQQE